MKQPLYKKIYAELHEAIVEGRLAPGSRVPTEKELSEQYQVSRITSKRALTELEQNQLIYRVQGSGSFVRELKEKKRLDEFCLSCPLPMISL